MPGRMVRRHSRTAAVLGAALAACLSGDVARAGAALPPPQKAIAVTVDDLPVGGPDLGLAAVRSINERLTATLKAEGIPAVGFVNEAKLYHEGEVDGRIALLQLWLDAGLELGNHTFSHPDLNKVGPAAYEEEVVRGETATRLLFERQGAGRRLRWFRHTYLRTGKTAEDKAAFDRFLADRGYTAVPVTVENDDWYFNSAYVKARARGDRVLEDKIAKAYLEHYATMFAFYEKMSDDLFHRQIRQILLCHDNQLNADHFAEVVAFLRARGYAFVTVEQALQDGAYAHEDGYVGGWGKSWLQRWLFSEGRHTMGQEPDPPKWIEAVQ